MVYGLETYADDSQVVDLLRRRLTGLGTIKLMRFPKQSVLHVMLVRTNKAFYVDLDTRSLFENRPQEVADIIYKKLDRMLKRDDPNYVMDKLAT